MVLASVVRHSSKIYTIGSSRELGFEPKSCSAQVTWSQSVGICHFIIHPLSSQNSSSIHLFYDRKSMYEFNETVGCLMGSVEGYLWVQDRWSVG